MAFFDQADGGIDPGAELQADAERRRPPRRVTAGLTALAVSLAALAALSFVPTSYVIENPGPVFDTLGVAKTADGDEVPLITIADAPTFPTSGSLDLLTVTITGNPDQRPSWFQLAAAWFDSSKAVVPLESVFPPGVSTEDRREESAQMMTSSQEEATAAALTELGYDVDARLEVVNVPEGSPAAGALQPGDVIRSLGGTATPYITGLREAIQQANGQTVTLGVERAGAIVEVRVTPAYNDENQSWQIGVSLASKFTFPVQVTIQLDNVGGPSAGQMFALGIMEMMTEEQLNGGQRIAGTGTIDAEGEIGAIGGIRQKLYGARDAGADYFLAPESNCDEVVGHVPSGIRVFSVEDLGDSLAVLRAIRTGGDLDALPTCTAG